MRRTLFLGAALAALMPPLAEGQDAGADGDAFVQAEPALGVSVFTPAAPAGPSPAPIRPAAPVPASLVADRIDFDETRLTATGNVEIFADGRVLRARRLTYLRAEDRLEVEGPLTLVDGPDRILVAEFASLGADLRASVLQGARLVLDQQLQIAAAEIATDESGRYTQLYRGVASSCEVCAANPVPLWQIRARRIVHDTLERQIYFENARFEVAGVPVAWLPFLRLPDPTLDRATGLLAPRFSSDDRLGTGIELPYFIVLGASRDLTLRPFVTNQDTRQLGFRYREAFDNGALEIDGAVARDDTIDGDPTRGYLFADGTFALDRGYRLEFDVEVVTDDAYLEDYDVSEKDRLDSRLAVERYDRDDAFRSEAVVFHSLRDGESNSFLPTNVLTVERQRRVPRAVLGGQAIWTLQAHGRERTANSVPEGLPPNSARDVLRASAAIDWRRSEVMGPGIVATAMAGLHVDAYSVRQDDTFDDGDFARGVPYGGLELRLPLSRGGADGTTHVIEPVAQVILSPHNRPRTPDEDSLTPEFDAGNLFSVQRFAGRDTRELGNRLNLGVGYTRHAASGWQLGALVGRVIRDDDLGQFRPGTGLDGKVSDWLVSVGVERGGLEVLTRSTFDGSADVSRSETALRWTGDASALETRYTWLEADEEAGRPIDTSEWALDAEFGLGGDWTGRANWRDDFVTDDASRAGLGLTYRSDCVAIDFDVERRFTSTEALDPTTRFGLGVELAGFGAEARRDRRRRCGI